MSSAIFDHEKQTNDLVSLFSSTLHSLAADAAVVRQASSLVHCTGIVPDEEDATTEREVHPANQALLDSFIGLDGIVTGLEEKVTALRQIVREEKTAVAKFEGQLAQEAEEQAYFVAQLVEALHQVVPSEDTHAKLSDETLSVDSLSDHSNSSSALRQKSSHSRRDSVDPRSRSSKPVKQPSSKSAIEEENQAPTGFSLPRITKEELKRYRQKHAMMGPRMLSLVNLNEALEEIEAVCLTQVETSAVLKSRQNQQSHLSSGALQRRYDYLQKRQQTSSSLIRTSLDGPLHNSNLYTGSSDAPQETISVTEQQLREKCAFFRHGESTARSTLSILCSLRRLKQIPAKNRQVTYLCLGQQSSDQQASE